MICISTDTDEELNELKKILDDTSFEHIIFAPQPNKNATRKTTNKILKKINESIDLIKTIKKHNITILIGAPCLRNRVAHLLTNVRYGSYIRSLHPDSKNASSLSDKIYFALKRIGIKSSFLNPYYADACFISTPINSKFLQARSIPLHKIKSIGAVWLENNKKIEPSNEAPRIVYLSQAYKEHNKPEAQAEQIEIVEKLVKISSSTNLNLVIRKHPRDGFNYNNAFKTSNISINSSSPQDFLHHLNKQDVIVSSFSTMAFEIAHLGGSVQFINLETITSYDTAFSDVGIKPTNWRDLQADQFQAATETDCKVFFDYTTLHLQEFCTET